MNPGESPVCSSLCLLCTDLQCLDPRTWTPWVLAELTADTRVRNLFLVHAFLDKQQLSREEWNWPKEAMNRPILCFVSF